MLYNSRVTKKADGSIRWICDTGKAFRRYRYRQAAAAVGAICLFFLAAGLYISVKMKDFSSLLSLFVICLLVMAVTALICLGLDWTPGNTRQAYEINDESVRLVSYRSRYFPLADVEKIIVCSDHLKLCGADSKIDVYVPEGDLSLVADYIMNRVPADMKVRYE